MTSEPAKIFLDTNIIAYGFDEMQAGKRRTSAGLLKQFREKGNAVLSNQVLAELYSVLTKKLKNPVSASDAAVAVAGLADSKSFEKINYTHETVRRAAALSANSETSFWDALIAETMLENGVHAIYTENGKDFRKISGIKAVNPFK